MTTRQVAALKVLRFVGSVVALRQVETLAFQCPTPRGKSMYGCQPDPSCQCHPWSIGPGETWPLRIDWTAWLASIPGYVLYGQPVISIEDMNVSPAKAADPAEVDTVPSYLSEETPTVPVTSFVGPYRNISETLIKIGTDVTIGRIYRLNINVSAKNCDGQILNIKDCVFITVQG